MKKLMVTMVIAFIAMGVVAQDSLVQNTKKVKVTLWGNMKFNSSTPGMIGGGMWSDNPSLTGTFGMHMGEFSFSAFRTSDLLDKSTNGNQTDVSIAWGRKFGNWKLTLANDVLLFDNNSLNMLVPRVVTTYSKGMFSIEALVTYCPMFKGESLSAIRVSPSITVQGWSFRLFVWEKYTNKSFSTPMALQAGKKLFQFSNGISISADVAYHLKDVTAKKLESFGWVGISVNF
ncbi:MAG: hypothetical protein LBI53_07260 [Candidatus Peribacteria bacterium]|nr:hypothetical protein [Candidatus Peribacteria bacterium]